MNAFQVFNGMYPRTSTDVFFYAVHILHISIFILIEKTVKCQVRYHYFFQQTPKAKSSLSKVAKEIGLEAPTQMYSGEDDDEPSSDLLQSPQVHLVTAIGPSN